MVLPIFIGSESDRQFIDEGLSLLRERGIKYEIIVSSTHRKPDETNSRIKEVLQDKGIKVIIAGSATATGLPGIVAGHLISKDALIFGVRFTKNPGPGIIEDAAFSLSSMPQGVPLAYTGFNEKGFLHACELASKVIGNRE